ncbi:MAG: protease complex subunit PrcB family protein [Epsilonproteobacteria bacterium]|nr:protease complex subunit PrcB family protein [Campylobacterota bacterium]
MKKKLLSLSIISAILFAGCNAGGYVTVGDRYPVTLTYAEYNGINTYITEPKTQKEIIIIKDENQFEKIYSFYNPSKTLPKIDFDEYEVIAVIDETRRSGGYFITVDEIQEYEDYISITITEKIPGSSCFVTLALTEPFVFIKIKKTDKSIKLKERQEIYSCP